MAELRNPDVPVKPHLEIILMKMFEGTGINYTPEYVKTQDWFLTHSWTEQQMDEYIEWLADYFYNNADARQEILNSTTKSKPYCKKAAEQFACFYGWTTSKVNKE
jgi:hypothetical protein